MLEKPLIDEDQIILCLQESYALGVVSLEFLPIGSDPNSWVYKITSDNGKYFLKIKKGEIYEPSIFIPSYLKGIGIEQVVAPLRTQLDELSVKLNDFTLILYPFIEGRVGMKVGLTDEQWRELGSVLKEIHSVQPPADLLQRVNKENFLLKWNLVIERLQDVITGGNTVDVFQIELSSFWKEKLGEIEHIVKRAKELGQELQSKRLDFVLCHTDVHTANIILSPKGEMFIIDWDNPIFAPKERDLMFIVGQEKNEKLFFEGYGKVEIDPVALAYYRYEWVVQEFADYGERMFFMSGVGEETKKDALKSFVELFQPDDVVEAAYRFDPKKKEFAAKLAEAEQSR